MKDKATWELKNIIKALSMMSVLNTDEENKRLEQAKQELKNRRVAQMIYINRKDDFGNLETVDSLARGVNTQRKC